jgi:HNH endonuclease
VSISKRFVNDPANVKRVIEIYLADDRPTTEETAKRAGTTFQTVIHILRHDLPPGRYYAEKKLRYSRAGIVREGNNPNLHPKGEAHPNWKGDVDDGYGYLTRTENGERDFVHRRVMAEALGIPITNLPPKLVIHHIDLNPLNNNLDNLALTTNVGHRELHRRRLQLHKLPLWGQWLCGMSKSKGTTPT